MSDNRINSRSTAGFDLLRDMLGAPAPRKPQAGENPASKVAAKESTSSDVIMPRGPASHRGSMFGRVGMRVLPSDFPLDQLDRDAPRGTYIDLMV